MEKKANHPYKLIAHRGLCKEYPENTIVAFQASIDLDVDGIELDVRLTSDEVPVVIHDAVLPGGRGPVSGATWQQIHSFDLEIPTLEKALALDSNGLELMIELKADGSDIEVMVDRVLTLMGDPKRNLWHGPLILGSKSPEIMELLTEQAPELPLIGIAYLPDLVEAHLGLGLKHLALSDPLATPEQLKVLGELGFTVWVWTVNDLERALELSESGVTGIITDDPRALS